MIPDPDPGAPPGSMVLLPVPEPLPPAGPPNPTSSDLGESFRFPSLTWDPVSWVDRYEVWVARAGNTFTRVTGRLRVGRRRRHRHDPPPSREL